MMIDVQPTAMKANREKLRPSEVHSKGEAVTACSGFAISLDRPRIDLDFSIARGWDFSDFAAFLRAQNHRWAQQTEG